MEEKELLQEAIIIDEEEMKKPVLKSEANAHIVGEQSIEENMKEVKKYAMDLKEYYGKITFTEEQVQEAKEEKANINKQKEKVADFRKKLVEEWKKPIEEFEKTAKETEKILKDAYELINVQVDAFNQKTLNEIKIKIKDYFDEYKINKGIDFIEFEQMNLSITKTLITSSGNLSKKALEIVSEFIDKIESDLTLIANQEHKEEILVEYKKNLMVANAINTVIERHKAIEEEQRRKELNATKEEQKQEMIEKVEEVLEAPKEEQEKPKIYKASFTIYGTIEQLKDIKNYIQERGVKYE